MITETSTILQKSEVAQAFAPEGALQKFDSYFHYREAQLEFALAVERTIKTPRGKLVVEAGTGTGKTYAYLVPVLLSGRKAIISTATKGLQDQLFLRDLPQMRNALKLPTTIALLKGRNNYLCLHRLELTQVGNMSFTPKEQRDLTHIIHWAQGTKTGDMAEMIGLDERSPIIPVVTSTRENCLSSECPHFRQCYLMQARKEAMAADVVVVNHHLFFADMAVKESGVAELLPTVDVVVFDEAHQLNDAGLHFLGVAWTTSQVLDFSRDMLASGLTYARSACNWTELHSQLEKSIRELRLLCKKMPMNARIAWEGKAPDGIDVQEWEQALHLIALRLEEIGTSLKPLQEGIPDLVRLYERYASLQKRLASFNESRAPEHIRWIEAGAALRLIESPLDIAQAMRERCFEGAQSWIFTSATLGDDEFLSWFTKQVGIEEAETIKLNSPFDYAHQAAIYIPENFPKPNEVDHINAVAYLAARLVEKSQGRAFVLTTTLRALKGIGEGLTAYFEEHNIDIEVLVQGSRPKRDLMERFRNHAGHSVLVGSQSFWEGIDVAGDKLQLVIIDKLPFPPPNDPLIQARCERIELEGGNAFRDISIPEAAVTLKQGAGRLIRRETDEGMLVICDPRLALMGYGKRILAALPPMQRIRSFDKAQAYIQQLRENR